jgi:hypothetical protein
MITIRISDDIEECRNLWLRTWPQDSIFDLWEVRWSFSRPYKHDPYFIVAEENAECYGLIALCRLENEQRYCHFPGELWQGKTWLEQNKIIAQTSHIAMELFDAVPEPAHIRYLLKTPTLYENIFENIDEIDFILRPRNYNFIYDLYLKQFSGKSRKKLNREMEHLEQRGITYRYDSLKDIENLFTMNLNNFGPYSYFYDDRFKTAFENLITFLYNHEYLRITTALVDGTIAAIDLGAVWNNTYTLLAGAANPDFPGIAKVINFHHIQWAFKKRIELIDFLCGDFGWKKRFHLIPRPLFEIYRPNSLKQMLSPAPEENYNACV